MIGSVRKWPERSFMQGISGLFLFIGLAVTAFPQITFERNYGGVDDDIGQCVRQTADGGYILCGYTKTGPAGNYDAYIIRTDEFGDTLWTRITGGPGYDATYSLDLTPDSGFLLCGTWFHPGKAHSDIWLIRMTSTGDTLWTRNNYSSTDAAAYSVEAAPGNGFVLTGIREDTGGNAHMFLMKINASGDTVWSRDFRYWSSSGGNAVVPTYDDGFLICGYMDNYTPSWNRNLGMVKTNHLGDTLWTRQFGGLAYEMGWSVCESSYGGYLASGYTTGFGASTGDAYLVKTTDLGILEWQKHFGKSGLDILFDIQNTGDLSYIATGISAEQGSELQEAWLLKLDQNGDTIWTRSFGGERKSYGYSVQQTEDDGYVFCGSTNASGTNIYDVLLVKTNEEGLITALPGEPGGTAALAIYPNPSSGCFRVRLPSGSEHLWIRSLSGKCLFSRSVRDQKELPMDLSAFPSGIYLIEVETDRSSFVKKLAIR